MTCCLGGIEVFKKRNIKGLILFVIIALTLVGCNLKPTETQYPTLITEDYNSISLDEINHYNIEVELNPEDKTYEGKETIKYINNTGVDLSDIYIHIYPNAFRRKQTAPYLYNYFQGAYPNGFEPGFLNIDVAKVKNKNVEFATEGKGSTILHLKLDSPLKSGENTKIYLEYTAKLPPAEDRFGYGDKTFNFGNWYPIVCVYDEDGWNTDPYYRLGDPFYSDISNYDVKITTPKDMIVASSGNIINEKTKGKKKIWEIEGKLIRDFAWVASKDFTVLKGDVEGTQLKMYFLDASSQIKDYAFDIARDSLITFNRIFGKYPYGQYSVVANNFSGGMEYPGLVFIEEGSYTDEYKEYLEKVIVHETAHQWWYGVVGNDEIDEAWLDESFATYSETIYMDEIYGEENGENYFKRNVEDSYDYAKGMFNFEEVPLKPLSQFTDWGDYGSLAYNRGAMFLNEIKDEFGKEVLYDILNKYYNKYRFSNAKTEDFIAVCEEVTGTDFKEKVNIWLYGKK